MESQELLEFVKNSGKDPAMLLFEDELTGIQNRRFLGNYFQHKIDWNNLSSRPVSLVMLDLDYFKQINDTHGHAAGDEALVHLAGILQNVAGNDGISIRYAGDEFMILLPGKNKKTAMSVGRTLLRAMRETPCKSEEAGQDLAMTLSIGVATAPVDAEDSKSLVHKADEALYHSKKSGRDQVTDAAETDPSVVEAKSALAGLGDKVAGRKTQLAVVVDLLKKLITGKSHFVLVEGEPGLGKSAFMGSVAQTLSRTRIQSVHVSGTLQEQYRPYYLAAEILMALLRAKRDRGLAAIKSLDDNQRSALTLVLPRLSKVFPKFDIDAVQSRELIFNTLAMLIQKIQNYDPLVILADDLQYADEASLLLLGMLLRRGEMPLFVCGSSDKIEKAVKLDSPPLFNFYEKHAKSLDIRTVRLTALSEDDLAELLVQLFPKLEYPPELVGELTRASRGNPLFLSEILYKLVRDRKIRYLKGNWTIEPLEEGYLPHSLEDIVQQKVLSLDKEGRKILDHAAAYGDRVSLSMLAGSSKQMEGRVLDFLDAASAQGLINTEFSGDDEGIRFTGNRVAQIVYGTMDQSEREQLHEDIGNYQESLQEKGLAPSAATLAYHFQRSANEEKAQQYSEISQSHHTAVFNTREAIAYTGEELEQDTPLLEESLVHVPNFIRSFLIAIRNARLYPKGSRLVQNAVDKLFAAAEPILAENDQLHLVVEKDNLQVNGEDLETADFKSIAQTFNQFMRGLELRGIIIESGLDIRELTRMISALCRVEKKEVQAGFWYRFTTSLELEKIQIQQVLYKEISDSEMPQAEGQEEAEEEVSLGDMDLEVGDGEEAKLEPAELAAAMEVTRSFLGAASKMRLYPPDGPVAGASISKVMENLTRFFPIRPYLILARVDLKFFVNGRRTDGTELEKLGGAMIRLFKESGLKSLSFIPQVTSKDFISFFTAQKQLPEEGGNIAFWTRTAREMGIQGILFDQTVYEVQDFCAGVPPQEPDEPEEEDINDEDLEPDKLVDRVRDLYLKGDQKRAAKIILTMFDKWPDQDAAYRSSLLASCKTMLEAPELASRPTFIKMVVEPLLEIFHKEQETGTFDAMAGALHETAGTLIRLGEYALAAWIFSHLAKRRKDLGESTGDRIRPLLMALDRELAPGVQKLLVADVVYGDREKQQKAMQLLGSLGASTVYLLADIIKQNDDIRTRQIAADWLAKAGPDATRVLKEEVMECASAQQCVRILEVIDTVTKDLMTELTYVLGDANPKVRQAAFALAERIKNPRVVQVLLEYATNEDPGLAEMSIRYLGRLKAAQAVPLLIQAAQNSPDPKIMAAACRALGQIQDPSSEKVLTEILQPKGWRFWRKKRPPLARSSAAWALAQIADPYCLDVLSGFTQDEDPRVREAAAKAAAQKTKDPVSSHEKE